MLTLGTQDPPETATLTLTLQNLSREDLGSVDYMLRITDLNDTPTLTVLLDDPIRVNADEAVAATVVATADPIETGQAMELLFTVVGMVTVNGVELPEESIGDLLTDHSFTLGGAVGRAREVVFQATPNSPNTGSAQFEVSARDDEGAISSTVAFTLIVSAASGDLLRIMPSTGTITTDEAALQVGVRIDSGVAVASSGEVGTVRVTVRRGVNGDLAGAALAPASGTVGGYLLASLPAEDDVVGWEYTQPGGGGTAAMNAQSLLQSLTLTLGTEDPPETATVMVTVQSDTGEAMDSVDYTLVIRADNDPPTLGAVENISITEDSGALAPTAVTTADPVEAGQAIDPAVAFEVTELTVRGDEGGSSIGDLLSPLSFSLDGDGTTVLFEATPVADRYGTAVFTVTVSDTGTPAASSAFAFTLAVEAVNDAPVITVAEDSRVLELVGGEQRGVVAELSDVDVSAADGNRDRFAQSGDSMVFRLPESVTDVALRLRADLVSAGVVSLGEESVATVQGDGEVLTTLTFTANLTADQVEALIAAVEVSADPAATAGRYELSITLTTDFNDGVVRQQEDRRPLTATAMAEVSVGRRAVLTVSFDPPAIALPADRERAVRLSVDPVPINSETITVMLDVESGTANAVSLPVSTVVFDSGQSATEVVVRVAAGIERNTTARVTIDASVTGSNVQASAGNSLLVRVVSGVLLRIRTFLEGALQ